MSKIFVKKKEQLITIEQLNVAVLKGFSEFSYSWISTILVRTDSTVDAY